MVLDIVFYIFVGIVAIQLLYYLGIFSRFAFGSIPTSNPKKIHISVIICAKNEEENVKRLIPLLLEQKYPDLEFVVINNASSNETLDIFREFRNKNGN